MGHGDAPSQTAASSRHLPALNPTPFPILASVAICTPGAAVAPCLRGAERSGDPGALSVPGCGVGPAMDYIARQLVHLARKPENRTCADCSVPLEHTVWAVLPHGAFVCRRCSLVHEALGPEVSRPRALDSGDWTREELDLVRRNGNSRVNEVRGHGHRRRPAPPPLHAQALTRDSSRCWSIISPKDLSSRAPMLAQRCAPPDMLRANSVCLRRRAGAPRRPRPAAARRPWRCGSAPSTSGGTL